MPTTLLSGQVIRSGSIPTTALGGGVISSSTQITTALPGGVLSSSAQYPGWVTASSQIDYNNIQNKLSGVVSSSTQVQPLLPGGTISSSTQYPGWVTASSQIDYNNIQNKLSGVVSSSAQVQSLLPGGTVSASGQVDITTTTNYSTFSSSIATKNDLQDISIGALNTATSSYAINSTIQNQLTGVVSSSTQTVAAVAGQTIAPAIINATGAISGASIQTSGNGTIGNNLTVATNALFVSSSRNVGIGTATPSASLHVSGTMMIQGVVERVNITGSAPPTTLNVDAMSGSVFYLSGSSANNWTVNFRGSAGTSLNTMMYDGQSMTFAVLVNHGATGYTASAHQVDGASITPRWQGGTVPSGSGTSTDIYSYTVIKRSSAVFNLFASQTKFA